ncbi:MAG: hypothetical protein UY10_C0024G0004 [Microgenomates group bacterium GW2011_GWA2_47_8]|nr:MAG: hypothetical protein UY10_C0024G0004 [Microgenomates group bacterium GW2011_GWA2_47_8]
MSTTLPQKITLSVLVLFSVTFASVVLPAQAQQAATDQVSLTAIPPRLGEDGKLKLKPGEKAQIDVRVRNSSTKVVSVKSSAIDFIVDEDGKTPVPLEGTAETNNRWSLASWLTVAPSQNTLQPNESGSISVVIDVPNDALPGGHYAMVVHQPTTGALDGENAGSATGINQRVGTLLYVIVDGPINEAAFIRDFSFTDFMEFGPVPFSFAVENESDVHIRPQMNIDIYNLFGRKVTTIQPTTKNIFPYESRSFSGQWEQIWGTGPYTARLTMSFGDHGAVVIARTSFWLLPVKLVIALIALIGILIIAFISIRRHIIHRRTDQSARIQELETQVEEMREQR